VFTSTDKATNQCNVMGVSKLFAERLITSGHYYAGSHDTLMCTVRFGNVLGSRGSFVPLLKEQIKSGGPVTVTEPEMTRFFMSRNEAINLMFKSLEHIIGGEVFILKMPVIKIQDLIDVMINEIAPKNGFNPKDIKIEKIGIKPGEKMYEELITQEEMERALDLGDMFALIPQVKSLWNQKFDYKGAKKVTKEIYSSKEEKPLTHDDIFKFLKEAGEL
ncbi:polysaccharide biosynthesis protein, partial [bacterium]|nr:polysaccharide biosynthesis protein [bacterium]